MAEFAYDGGEGFQSAHSMVKFTAVAGRITTTRGIHQSSKSLPVVFGFEGKASSLWLRPASALLL